MAMLDVLPAEEADCDALAELILRAFTPQRIHQRLFGKTNPEEHAQLIAAQTRTTLVDPNKVVVKVMRGGDLVGQGAWTLPHSAGTAEPSLSPGAKRKNELPKGTNMELAGEMFSSRPQIEGPHLYIDNLAVDPAAQGTGVGTALLRAACRRADSQDIPVYLRATPEGISLYRRFGFEPYGNEFRPKSDPDISLSPMVRRITTFSDHILPEELPRIAEIQRLAFEPTAIVRYLHPTVDPKVYEEFFVKQFDKLYKAEQEKQGGSSVIDVARRGETILGYAWSTREPAAKDRQDEVQESEERPIMAGTNETRYREFMGALERHSKSVPFAHWTLHVLSVDPRSQRAGVGRRLLQRAMDRATGEHLPLTLESTELGLPLYRSMGFKDFAVPVVAEEDLWVKFWPLVYGYNVSESA